MRRRIRDFASASASASGWAELNPAKHSLVSRRYPHEAAAAGTHGTQVRRSSRQSVL